MSTVARRSPLGGFVACLVGAVLVACGGEIEGEPATLPPADDGMVAIAASELCVSTGHVELLAETGETGEMGERALAVRDGTMEATVAGDSSRDVEVAFDYLGPSASLAPLGDGEVRQQIGLVLLAKDACNLVYVTWRIEAATPGVFVTMKHDAHASQGGACAPTRCLGATPRLVKDTPPVTVGEAHTLRASLDGDSLRVLADGELVWEGPLPAEALAGGGPAGVRSDNGAFELELRVPAGAARSAECARAMAQ